MSSEPLQQAADTSNHYRHKSTQREQRMPKERDSLDGWRFVGVHFNEKRRRRVFQPASNGDNNGEHNGVKRRRFTRTFEVSVENQR